MLDGDGLTGQAYQRLKQAILSGDLASGEALLESRLANKLGMSRTPVREALLVLAREGLVEMNARGFGVPRPSLEDLRELFELRESLEGTASRAAALRANEVELRAIDELCEKFAGAQSLDAWAEIGTHFHNAIVSAARNRRLTSILDSLKDQIVQGRQTAMLGTETRWQESIREHRGIVDAIKARDADAAEQRARAHVRLSYEATMRSLTGY